MYPDYNVCFFLFEVFAFQVPNQSLQVHALKLSDIRGWSMLCEDAVSMLALHIPGTIHTRINILSDSGCYSCNII